MENDVRFHFYCPSMTAVTSSHIRCHLPARQQGHPSPLRGHQQGGQDRLLDLCHSRRGARRRSVAADASVHADTTVGPARWPAEHSGEEEEVGREDNEGEGEAELPREVPVSQTAHRSVHRGEAFRRISLRQLLLTHCFTSRSSWPREAAWIKFWICLERKWSDGSRWTISSPIQSLRKCLKRRDLWRCVWNAVTVHEKFLVQNVQKWPSLCNFLFSCSFRLKLARNLWNRSRVSSIQWTAVPSNQAKFNRLWLHSFLVNKERSEINKEQIKKWSCLTLRWYFYGIFSSIVCRHSNKRVVYSLSFSLIESSQCSWKDRAWIRWVIKCMTTALVQHALIHMCCTAIQKRTHNIAAP